MKRGASRPAVAGSADSVRRRLCGGVRVVLGARYVAACFLQVSVRRVRLRLSRGIVSREMGLGPGAGARASTVTWSAVGGVPRSVSALNLLWRHVELVELVEV